MYFKHTSNKGKAIKKKIRNGLTKKNYGFTTMESISKILDVEETSLITISEELTQDDVCHLKYTPITSMDVERSIPMYRNILLENRRSLVIEHIKQYITV